MNEQLEQTQDYQMRLVEGWSNVNHDILPNVIEDGETVDFMEGIEGDTKKMMVAQLLENSRKYFQSMQETTKMMQVGEYEKFIFPVIRAAYANIVIDELVSVQPMDARVGQVFYMDAIYDSTKGSIKRGNKMNSSTGGPSSSQHFADEVVEDETVGSGDGAISLTAGTLTWTPIRPGTVEFTDGTQEVTDDGNGGLQGDSYSGGTINYVSGAFTFSFLDAPDNGDAITVSYEYDSECQTPPQVAIQLVSSPVVARPYKLAALWCLEAQQELQSYHGMNIENEIVSFASNEIQKEIMYSIINQLFTVASAGNVVWDINPAAGVQEYYHRQSIVNSILVASGNIFQATQRDQATWMVCGVTVATVLKGLSNVGLFKPAAAQSGTVGMRYIGDVAGIRVYEMPSMNTNTALLGRKGTSMIDTGYIYAPYLGLFTTPTIMLEDMKARKGMKLSCAKKVTDTGQFATLEITNSAV